MFTQLLGVKAKRKVAHNFFEYDLADDQLQADQWKVYPCAVTPWTVIEKWYKAGTYKPYGTEGTTLR